MVQYLKSSARRYVGVPDYLGVMYDYNTRTRAGHLFVGGFKRKPGIRSSDIVLFDGNILLPATNNYREKIFRVNPATTIKFEYEKTNTLDQVQCGIIPLDEPEIGESISTANNSTHIYQNNTAQEQSIKIYCNYKAAVDSKLRFRITEVISDSTPVRSTELYTKGNLCPNSPLGWQRMLRWDIDKIPTVGFSLSVGKELGENEFIFRDFINSQNSYFKVLPNYFSKQGSKVDCRADITFETEDVSAMNLDPVAQVEITSIIGRM